MYKTKIPSPIGTLICTVEEGCITELKLPPYPPFQPENNKIPEPTALTQLKLELAEYFSGSLRAFSIPLSPNGTAFQISVWNALRRVPYGEVKTYGEIASELGNPKAARAVGMACHNNPILLLIPCHRIVSSTSLGGFAVGVSIKQTLLSLESQPIFRIESLLHSSS